MVIEKLKHQDLRHGPNGNGPKKHDGGSESLADNFASVPRIRPVTPMPEMMPPEDPYDLDMEID